MKKHVLLFFAIIFLFAIENIQAQYTADTLPSNYKRNIVKWNMTPFMLWSYKNINFSYERILTPKRSFSVNAGYFELPSSGIYDSLNIKSANKRFGYSVSGDYRFYMKGRNVSPAPDGIYWGVYGSFHHYEFSNNIEVINSPTVQGELMLDGKLNILSVGAELGYQFVIKEKLTIDLIFMGPSISMYNYQLGLQSDLTTEEEDEYLQGVQDVLYGLIPGLEKLVDEKLIDENGASTSFGFGLRYMVQIGYRF
ncbi:MAG: DUF3575 domain-containing protein [Chlorobi bacterium]|nr:DUF3575 domain-containing protein [Chlorobiota bacterium]